MRFPKAFVRDAGVQRFQSTVEDQSGQLDALIKEIQGSIAQTAAPAMPEGGGSLDDLLGGPAPVEESLPPEELPAQPGTLDDFLTEPASVPGADMGLMSPMGTSVGGADLTGTSIQPGVTGLGDDTYGMTDEMGIEEEEVPDYGAPEPEDYGEIEERYNASMADAQTGPGNANVRRYSALIEEAAVKYGISPSMIAATMDHESGGRTVDANGNPLRSSAGAIGLMQVMPFHFTAEDGSPDDPRVNIMKGAKILADNYRKWGDADKAVAAYFGALNSRGEITDASDGGTTGTGYVESFNARRGQYVDMDSEGAAAGPWYDQAGNFVKSKGRDLARIFEGSLTPDQLNLGDGATWAEAIARCGPAAVYAWIAQAGGAQTSPSGKLPTLDQINDLARAKGLWSEGTGMFGPQAEVKLMQEYGIKAKFEAGRPDPNKIMKELMAGNPVTLSTEGHYFTIEGVDSRTGKWDVGNSGKVYKGGSEFMTIDEMERLSGGLQGAIFADSPLTDGISTANDHYSDDLNPTEGFGDYGDRLGSVLDETLSSGPAAQEPSRLVSMDDMLTDVADDPMQGPTLDPASGEVFYGGQFRTEVAKNKLDQAIDAVWDGRIGELLDSAGTVLDQSTARTQRNLGGVLGEGFTPESQETRRQIAESGDWFEYVKNVAGTGVKAGVSVRPALALGLLQDISPVLEQTRWLPSFDKMVKGDFSTFGDASENTNWGPFELATGIMAAPTAFEKGIGATGKAMQAVSANPRVQAAIVPPVVKTLDSIGRFVEGVGQGADVLSALTRPQLATEAGALPFQAGVGRNIDQMLAGGTGRELPQPPANQWEQLEQQTMNNGGATYDPTNQRYWDRDGFAVGGVVDPDTGIPSATFREVFDRTDTGWVGRETGLSPAKLAENFYTTFKNTIDQAGNHIGTWTQKVKGEEGAWDTVKEVFFDASEVFEDFAVAQRTGIQRGQQAIFRFGDEKTGAPSGDVPLMGEYRSEAIQAAIKNGHDEAGSVLALARQQADRIKPLDETGFPVASLASNARRRIGEIAEDQSRRSDPDALKEIVDPEGMYPGMRSLDEYVRIARTGSRFANWYPEIRELLRKTFGDKNLDEVARFTWAHTSSRAAPETNMFRSQTLFIITRENAARYNEILADPQYAANEAQRFNVLVSTMARDYQRKAIETRTLQPMAERAEARREREAAGGAAQYGPGIPVAFIQDTARAMMHGGKDTEAVKTPVYGAASALKGDEPVAPLYAVLDTWMHRIFGVVGRDARMREGVREGNLLASGGSARYLRNWEHVQALNKAVADELGMTQDEAQAALWVPYRAVWEKGGRWRERLLSQEEPADELFAQLMEDDPDFVSKLGGTATAIENHASYRALQEQVERWKDTPPPGRMGEAVILPKGDVDVSGLAPLSQARGGYRQAGMALSGAGAGTEAAEGDEGVELSPLQTGALGAGALLTANPRVAQRFVDAWNTRPKPLPKGSEADATSVTNRLMYSSMLSSTTTALQNLFTGAGEVAWKLGVDSLTQSPRTTIEEMKGVIGGAAKGIESALQVLRYGYSDVQAGRSQAFGSVLAPGSTAGTGPVGTILAAPIRILSAGDEFFYNIVYSMEAHRAAVESLKNQDLVKGGDFWAAVDYAAANPSQEILDKAKKAADQATFRNELGDVGRAVEKAIKRTGPLGTLVVPFTHAVMNITARTAERVPVVGAALMKARGAETREIVGTQALGTAMVAGAAAMYQAGLISGSGPKDPQERKELQRQGWAPYSVKMNGQWRSIEMLGPMTGPMMAAVTAMEAFGTDAKEGKTDTLSENTIQSIQSFGKYMKSQSILEGFMEFAELVTGGGLQANPAQSAGRYIGGAAGRFVPGAVNQASRAVDPYARETEGEDLAETARNQVINRTPLRQTLNPQLDVMGEKIVNPQQGSESFLPFRVGPINRVTPAERILNDHGIEVSDVKKTTIGDVNLNKEQQRMYRGLAGQSVQYAVEAVSADEEFKSMTAPEQKRMLESAVANAKKIAEEAVVPYEEQKAQKPEGEPWKYMEIQDLKEERRVDRSVSKVAGWLSAIKEGEDLPEPTEEEFDVYYTYKDTVSPEYKEYLAGLTRAGRMGRR